MLFLSLHVMELGDQPVHPQERSLGFEVGTECKRGQPLFRSSFSGELTQHRTIYQCTRSVPVCVCSPEVNSGCCSSGAIIQLVLFSFKTELHWDLGLSIWLGWLVREPQESSCFVSSSMIASMYPHAKSFLCVQWDWVEVLTVVENTTLPDWAILST